MTTNAGPARSEDERAPAPEAAGRRPESEGRDAAGVIAPPPFIYLAALAVGFGLDALLPPPELPGTLARAAGVVLLAGGLSLSAWFFVTFRRAQTPVDVRKPTAALVTTGPFRLSRNPAYVSLTLIYAGIALLANVVWAFASLVAALVAVQQGVIKREERYLERKFGDRYLRYKARTRRWI